MPKEEKAVEKMPKEEKTFDEISKEKAFTVENLSKEKVFTVNQVNPFSVNDRYVEEIEAKTNPFALKKLLINEKSPEIDNFVKKEISDYIDLISFTNSTPEVNPSIDLIEEILESLLLALIDEENEFLDIINTPIYPDPIEKLYILQNTGKGGLIRVSTLDLILLPEHSYTLVKNFNKEDCYSRGIYLQLIFDCINEALNYIRPYGVEGIPSAWSTKAVKIVGESSITAVFEKVQVHLFKWWSIKGGIISVDMDRDPGLTRLREERMSAMLCSEAESNEKQWLDYEDEETQVLIDLGNKLLEYLVSETINIPNI